MYYFVGIDGGGTKTRSILSDENLKIIKVAEAGPTNPHIVGFKKSAETIAELILKLCRKHKEVYIVAGISGAGRNFEAEKLKKKIKSNLNSSNINVRDLRIVSDAQIALEGAIPNKPGMLLIAGTGSILIYKDIKGNINRIGGYGRLIGDEGSGYSIGRKGLAIAAKSFDKRMTKNMLPDIIKKELNVSGKDQFILKVYSAGFDIASIAPIVIRAAQKGDHVSRKILDEEAGELADHIRTAAENFNPAKINLCFYGGLISERNYYSDLLRKKIKSRFKNILIRKAEYPPEVGAILSAKKIFLTDKSRIS